MNNNLLNTYCAVHEAARMSASRYPHRAPLQTHSSGSVGIVPTRWYRLRRNQSDTR